MNHVNTLAIEFIESYAKTRREEAMNTIKHVCEMSNISQESWEQMLLIIRQQARIGIHFHPYRLQEGSRRVIDSLLIEGKYKNQFETKISNGSPSAFEGGKRDLWENKLFHNLFADHSISTALRPKYGGLALLNHSDGPCPRFGSCYFLLSPSLSQYATFSYRDSSLNPMERGTLSAPGDLMAGLFSESFERGFALGEHNIRPDQLRQKIVAQAGSAPENFVSDPPRRNLDHYIEAQVHSEIDLLNHAEILVADKSFQGTEYESLFRQLCEKYEIQLRWNNGFELPVSAVPDNFRGNQMPFVAAQIAIASKVNAYALAKAEAKISDRKPPNKEVAETQVGLQELKYLWHTLVKFGKAVNH